jgi:hypothetical protein
MFEIEHMGQNSIALAQVLRRKPRKFVLKLRRHNPASIFLKKTVIMKKTVIIMTGLLKHKSDTLA